MDLDSRFPVASHVGRKSLAADTDPEVDVTIPFAAPADTLEAVTTEAGGGGVRRDNHGFDFMTLLSSQESLWTIRPFLASPALVSAWQ